MTSEEIFKTMQDLIAEQFAVNADDVTMNSSFEDDLSADSVDLVELVMAMEEEFEIDEIPEEHLEKRNIPRGYGYSEKSQVQKEFAFRAPSQQGFKKPVAPPSAPKPKAAEKPQFSVGDRVRHKAFGDGKLVKMTPMGNDYLIEIEFDSGTVKKLMLRAAALHMVKI